MNQFSVNALGITPYLAASMLVMTIFYLFRFKKGLDEQKYPLHLYTILLTIIWIIFQSSGLIQYYENIYFSMHGVNLIGISGFIFKIGIVMSLIGATLILVWIAHLITNYGIGNGQKTTTRLKWWRERYKQCATAGFLIMLGLGSTDTQQTLNGYCHILRKCCMIRLC